MMKRTFLIAIAALACLTSALSAQAKIQVDLGGGITEPVGRFGDVAKLGWHGLATFAVVPAGSPIAIQATGYYGENKFDPSGGTFQLLGGLGEIRFDLKATEGFGGFALAGFGLMDVKARPTGGGTASDTKTAFDVGAGLRYLVSGKVGLFAAARYVNVFTAGEDLKFVPVSVGLRLGF